MSELGGKYQLGERIGGGGMADVFRATIHGAEGFSRPVAIKQIKKSISRDQAFADLFITEAKIAAQLIHTNIVQTIDFDRDPEGRFYLVMELIEGIDLRQLVRSGRIPIAACVHIASEVLRGLDFAHELVDAGGRRITIVHRDISPHNIMLGWQGVVKVVDFGIAKAIEKSLVSRSGSLKGKVSYMSPEQVHGHGLDGRSDLFALGIVLHEILTGERLFVAKTEAATLSRLLTQPIPRPSALNDQVPADLDNIVMRLLERDREHRYTRARDAMDALIECSVPAKGRSQLETVLTERFSDRVPQRVARLNSSASSNSFSTSYETSDSQPDLLASAADGIASAETVAATPSSKSTPSGAELGETTPSETTPGPTPSPLPDEVKRTVTASPVTAAAELSVDDPDVFVQEKSKRGRGPLFAGIALLAAGSLSAYVLSKESGGEKEQAQPVLVGVDSPDASLDVGISPTGATLFTVKTDAGTSQHLSDAQPSSLDAKPQSPDAGTEGSKKNKSDEKDKKGKLASLTIRVQPWATVEVDGKRYGQTPQTIELRPGKHKIVLTNSGLQKKESFTLSLKPGKRKRITKDWR